MAPGEALRDDLRGQRQVGVAFAAGDCRSVAAENAPVGRGFVVTGWGSGRGGNGVLRIRGVRTRFPATAKGETWPSEGEGGEEVGLEYWARGGGGARCAAGEHGWFFFPSEEGVVRLVG